MVPGLHASTPFFLVGAVRSGTTVLRLMLGHHPLIARCEEFEYVAAEIAHTDGWPDVEAYRTTLPHRLDVQLAQLPCIPTASSFPELARELLLLHARAEGFMAYGATVHHHFDQLVRIWPDARFLYLRRDPRDVTRSCVRMGWAGKPWGAVPIWTDAEDSWARLCAIVPEERRLEIRFESMIVDHVAELQRICAFVGVPYDRTMVEIERDTTYQRPDPNRCHSWRHSSATLEIREVEARLGRRLIDAGYEPSGLPKLVLGPWYRLSLTVANRLGRVRFHQRRYGLWLWALGVLARRLPMAGIRRWVQREMDRINVRHMK